MVFPTKRSKRAQFSDLRRSAIAQKNFQLEDARQDWKVGGDRSIMFKRCTAPLRESNPRCSLPPVCLENKLQSLNRGAAISGFGQYQINRDEYFITIKYVNRTRRFVTLFFVEAAKALSTRPSKHATFAGL
jgi:hypothetical protein